MWVVQRQSSLPYPVINTEHPMKKPNGPRNLKAGGFTNGLWRLDERAARKPRTEATIVTEVEQRPADKPPVAASNPYPNDPDLDWY
jgi:hypothetical protein